MASAAEIKTVIESIVSNYPIWNIGVTDDPIRRKREHHDPSSWHQFDADTEQAARDVEAHFIAKGMEGGVGGSGRADYVYIF